MHTNLFLSLSLFLSLTHAFVYYPIPTTTTTTTTPDGLTPYPYNLYDDPLASQSLLAQVLDEAINNPDPTVLNKLADDIANEEDYERRQAMVVNGGTVLGGFSLSFDEGPCSNTRQLLSILAQHKVTCAFHIDPFKVTSTTLPLVKEMLRLNHVVGLAVVSTVDLKSLSLAESQQHILAAFNAFKKRLGWTPLSVRLPKEGYSSADVEYACSLGLIVSEPNYDLHDYEDPQFISTLSELISQSDPLSNSFVLVLRDKYINSVNSVSDLISLMTNHGYQLLNYQDNTGIETSSEPSAIMLGDMGGDMHNNDWVSMLIKNQKQNQNNAKSNLNNNQNGKAAALIMGPAKKIIPKVESLATSSAAAIKTFTIGGLIVIVALFI
ncbi:hypothetical protein NEHOM01_0486 [Nematocida homosporus]|uniref:uncharacterized protein n=1 Tax=Nematocida homosporus TaxID=1912981 RepID=UPI0022207042|nr:uncharacterized protein NEHOM01_0486 [Nematocida homosporus]KAI5184935.1 hypothetical protein NEHOM01_0486 [Nematocida homosporus]